MISLHVQAKSDLGANGSAWLVLPCFSVHLCFPEILVAYENEVGKRGVDA